MELIVIDEKKIKLTLTAEEMTAYHLTGEDARSYETLRGVLRDAREKCGCRGMNGRVCIEMYPSKKGGCELFVTKLAERERENRTDMKPANEGLLAEYRKYVFRGRVIYVFDAMAHLLTACRGLAHASYDGVSVAYHDECARKFYLILDRESPVAGEHMGSLCPGSAYYYIAEHCRRMCEDAVETLGGLA